MMRRAGFVGVLALLGCWAASSCSSTKDVTAMTTVLPACSWPAALDDVDASAGACRGAARAVVSCQGPIGGGAICLSDDPARCDFAGAPDPSTCEDLCRADEYGIVCGSVGPGPTGTPPAGCRGQVPTPAGVVFYCCPCEVPK